MLDDPDVRRYTRLPEPVSADRVDGAPDRARRRIRIYLARTWLERYEEGRRDGTREAYAIVGEAGEFLGLALAVQIDPETLTAELGYAVAPTARRRGVATEALRQLSDWAFDQLEMLRLELRISVENVASKKVAERCGYVREGVLRSLDCEQDAREDMEIWSRLPSDP